MKQSSIIIFSFLCGIFINHLGAQERLMRINTSVGTYVTQTQGNNKQIALDVIMNLIVENIRLKKAAGITE